MDILPYLKDFALPMLGALIGFAGSAFGQHLSFLNNQKHKKLDNIDTLLRRVYELQFHRYLTNMWSYTASYESKTADLHHHFSTLSYDGYKESLSLANEIMSTVYIHFPELGDYIENLHLKTINAIRSKSSAPKGQKTTPETELLTKVLDDFRDALKEFRKSI